LYSRAAACCSALQCVAAQRALKANEIPLRYSCVACVAVCCSALQCVAAQEAPNKIRFFFITRVLQCGALCGSVLQRGKCSTLTQCLFANRALQCVVVRCSVLQCVAVHCSVSQRRRTKQDEMPLCYSCVAVCCSGLLQCVAARGRSNPPNKMRCLFVMRRGMPQIVCAPNASAITPIWDMTHSYVRHNSFIFIQVCHRLYVSQMRLPSHLCGT